MWQDTILTDGRLVRGPMAGGSSGGRPFWWQPYWCRPYGGGPFMAGGLCTVTILEGPFGAEFSSEVRPLWYRTLLARAPLAEIFTDGRPFNGVLPCGVPNLDGGPSDRRHVQTEACMAGDLHVKRSLWQIPLGEDCSPVSVRM